MTSIKEAKRRLRNLYKFTEGFVGVGIGGIARLGIRRVGADFDFGAGGLGGSAGGEATEDVVAVVQRLGRSFTTTEGE